MRLGRLPRYAQQRGGPRMDAVLGAGGWVTHRCGPGESYGTDAVTPIA